MTIEIITMWYNEEFLAPFFLRHYDWVDTITLLFDVDTSDATRDAVSRESRVHVIPFRFRDGFDDALKQVTLNRYYRESQADWVLLVDADEFMFRVNDAGEAEKDLRPLLRDTRHDVFPAHMLNVYRHEDEGDLDPALPALMQRRHGVFDSIKPCVARGGLAVYWQAGCHEIVCNQDVSFGHDLLSFAHWSMADPNFAIERRLKNRRARMSRANFEKA